MDEERWSFSQIALATGLDQQCLQRLRRVRGLEWQPKGYTLAQIRSMGCEALPVIAVGRRSKKAQRLRALLAGEEETGCPGC